MPPFSSSKPTLVFGELALKIIREGRPRGLIELLLQISQNGGRCLLQWKGRQTILLVGNFDVQHVINVNPTYRNQLPLPWSPYSLLRFLTGRLCFESSTIVDVSEGFAAFDDPPRALGCYLTKGSSINN
jgi:hypothetical protein